MSFNKIRKTILKGVVIKEYREIDSHCAICGVEESEHVGKKLPDGGWQDFTHDFKYKYRKYDT